MSKVHAYFLADTVAGGLARKESKIYALDEKTAAAVFANHTARAASEEEVKRLGVTPEPERAADLGLAPVTPLAEREAAKAARDAKAGAAAEGGSASSSRGARGARSAG